MHLETMVLIRGAFVQHYGVFVHSSIFLYIAPLCFCKLHHCAFVCTGASERPMAYPQFFPPPVLSYQSLISHLVFLSIDIRYSTGDFVLAADGRAQRFLSFSRSSLGKVGKNSICGSL